ncbi:MAG: hypothetical protein ACJAS1_001854 [Oleiphilaceae bacterium]|jgi:hypothetical protein
MLAILALLSNATHRTLIGYAGYIAATILDGLDIDEAMDIWDTDYDIISKTYN